MPELTLEILASRIAAIEKLLADERPATRKKDWQRVAGMFTENDFQQEIDAEGAAIRDAEPSEESENSSP